MIQKMRNDIPENHPIRALFHRLTERGLEQSNLHDSGTTQYITDLLTDFVQAENLGWMPDGKAVYFAGSDDKGWRMYLHDVAGGAARPVTPFISIKRSHVETDLVSPDGRLMFARDVNGKGMLYPLAGGDPQLAPGWLPDDLWVNWTADGHSAYVYNDDKTNAPVFKLDLTTGKREPVMTLAVTDPAGVTAISNVRMTRDGKAYGYTFAREMSDLFLVEGVH